MRKCICQRWAIGAIAAMSWLCAGSNISRAAIAFYYDANAATPAPDPTTFAGGPWTLTTSGTGTSITTTPGQETVTGPNYWEVNDGVQNGSKSYQVSGTSTSAVGAVFTNQGGWEANVTLKVLSSANPTLTPPSYNAPTVFDLRNGARIYDLAFVNDGTNESVYNVPGGTTFNNSNKIMDLDLHDGYNTFTILYHPDPTSPTADVFLNGGTTPIFTFTNSNTSTSTVFREFWGSGLQGATQDVRWQYVDLQVLPEPASLALLGACSIVLRRARR